jgi:hypothetical protein
MPISNALSSSESKPSASGSPVSQRDWFVMAAILPELMRAPPRAERRRLFVHHVIVRWPTKLTVIHPHRFPTAADIAARTFAAAAVRLAGIKRERRL